MKVRRTKKALEYIEEWDQETVVQSDSPLATADPAKGHIDQEDIFVEVGTPKKERKRKKKVSAANFHRRREIHKAKVPMRLERRKRKKKT